MFPPVFFFLMSVFDVNSMAAKSMSKADLEKRQRGEEEKKKKLANPNFFVRVFSNMLIY